MEKIKFNSEGLIPVIVQQYNSKEVLMLAWMNNESLEETIKTNKTCLIIILKSIKTKITSARSKNCRF